MEKREKRGLCEEFRFVDGEKPRIQGYAALFNVESRELPFGREIIAPGAFTKTISEGDVKAFWAHQPGMPIASTRNGTLSLREDSRGLFVDMTPDDTSWSQDAIKSVRAGTVDGFSFGFRKIRDEWRTAEDGVPLRTLREVELFEVSPDPNPAYEGTDIAVRSLDAWREHESRDLAAASASLDLRRRRLDLLEQEAACS